VHDSQVEPAFWNQSREIGGSPLVELGFATACEWNGEGIGTFA
jgi:hypothetical protein